MKERARKITDKGRVLFSFSIHLISRVYTDWYSKQTCLDVDQQGPEYLFGISSLFLNKRKIQTTTKLPQPLFFVFVVNKINNNLSCPILPKTTILKTPSVVSGFAVVYVAYTGVVVTQIQTAINSSTVFTFVSPLLTLNVVKSCRRMIEQMNRLRNPIQTKRHQRQRKSSLPFCSRSRV